LHLVGSLYEIYIMMHGSMNVKLKKTDQHLHVIHDTFRSLCTCMYTHSVI